MRVEAASDGLRLLQRPAQVEASLWRRWRFSADPDCRDQLFQRYEALARQLARREFRNRPAYGLERGDFEQLAVAGLLEAIDRFDPLRGAPFAAYAKYRIRGAIADGLAKSSEAGALYSKRRRNEAERLASLRETVTQADPLTELSVLTMALAIGFIAETAAPAEEGLVIADLEPDAYTSLAWREIELCVLKEVSALSASERLVIERHYFEGVAFSAIAVELGVSRGRVSQLHRAALDRLRIKLKPTVG